MFPYGGGVAPNLAPFLLSSLARKLFSWQCEMGNASNKAASAVPLRMRDRPALPARR
jgi:hypothetical protein